MHSFAIMVNSRTLSDLVKIVRLLKLLLCSRVKSLSMIESHDALVDIINGFNDVLDENQHKDGETSYEEIFDDDKIGICKQPCNICIPRGRGLHLHASSLHAPAQGHQPLGQTTQLHTCTRTIYRAR